MTAPAPCAHLEDHEHSGDCGPLIRFSHVSAGR